MKSIFRFCPELGFFSSHPFLWGPCPPNLSGFCLNTLENDYVSMRQGFKITLTMLLIRIAFSTKARVRKQERREYMGDTYLTNKWAHPESERERKTKTLSGKIASGRGPWQGSFQASPLPAPKGAPGPPPMGPGRCLGS